MSFDAGAMNFRCFYLSRAFESADLEHFARHQLPPLSTLTGDQPLHGWTGPAHALDLDFSEDHCCFEPYLQFTHVTAAKKIPPSTLRAYLRMELDLELKARDLQFLPRQVKAEVKERVQADLIKHVLPSFASMPCLLDMRNQRLLAGAMSDRAAELLCPFFRETTGCMPVALLPESAALRRRNVNVNDLNPENYTPNEAVSEPAEVLLGTDFLTWLFWYWEKGENVFQFEGETYGMMFEGPLTFFSPDVAGAHETVLRNGTPLDSPEFGTALWNGKKLRRAKLTFTHGELIVSATIDALDFSFHGLKVPKGEQEDPIGILRERMDAADMFVDTFLNLFDRYLDLRTDRAQWHETLGKLRQWIAARAGQSNERTNV